MRTLLVLFGAASVLIAAACGGSDQSSQVKGVPWRWSAHKVGGDFFGLVPIPDPENYLLRLDDDGSFVAKADCKSVLGTYSLSGDELTLDVGPTRKIACGAGSRAAEYVDLLRKVATYEVYDEGALTLGLAGDAGRMYFYAGAASLSP